MSPSVSSARRPPALLLVPPPPPLLLLLLLLLPSPGPMLWASATPLPPWPTPNATARPTFHLGGLVSPLVVVLMSLISSILISCNLPSPLSHPPLLSSSLAVSPRLSSSLLVSLRLYSLLGRRTSRRTPRRTSRRTPRRCRRCRWCRRCRQTV